VNRRDAVIGLLAVGTIGGPLRTNAQTTNRDTPFRITTLPDLGPVIGGWVVEAMGKHGWAVGRDFVVVPSGLQYGGGKRELDEVVNRVVADKPDLILCPTTAYAAAAHNGTTSIPIVMISSGYPVDAGLGDSLARPGRNVTGNTAYAGAEVWSKLLQLLRDVIPGLHRVGVLWTYVPPLFPREDIEPAYAELRTAEDSLGLKLHVVNVARVEQLTSALAEIQAERPEGLLLTSAFAPSGRPAMTRFALDNRLPTITDVIWPAMIDPYPLLSYGTRFEDLVRNSASYIDRIMRGAKPGDLPIQLPAKFELVINLKSARALGLTIPPSLLARADEVIE
jgi:putative ABC transport system substrate-binding protein